MSPLIRLVREQLVKNIVEKTILEEIYIIPPDKQARLVKIYREQRSLKKILSKLESTTN